jgi:hypothetical protein
MENICCELASVISNLERIASRAATSLVTNGNEFVQSTSQSGSLCLMQEPQ